MSGQEVTEVLPTKAVVPRKGSARKRKRAPNKAHIRHWPKRERPREKLLERGAHALSDAELLAVLLRCGTKGRNAIELAQAHIVEFGSLRELLMAEWSRWNPRRKPKPGEKRLGGVGVAGYASLQAGLELARRHLLEPIKVGSALSEPDTTRKFLLAQLRNRPYEVFCVLYLNNRHRLLAFEELFRGTTDNAHVHIKEVMRQAIIHNATSVIVAHNHPSGVTEPSHADEYITRRLKDSLALMEVRMLDHVIVGD
ncbi:MAG TPA: DNA repair protein RadC, partial [Steroidobacteraceae bacterium]